ncbi:MAG: SurA N-terminal domain-containing protein, partial [Geminicoccaceae bacterium]
MLNALRSKATGWVIKIFLGLLIVSFALWGIGDIFTGPRNPTVASVGSGEVTVQELSQAFQRDLSRLQQQTGQGITREQAIGLGVLNRSLQSLIGDELIAQGASGLDLTVADETLRQQIFQDPLFLDDAGQFDRNRFDTVLRSAGLTEEDYLTVVSADLKRRYLIDSVAAPVRAPQAIVDTLYRHRNEQRSGRALIVDAAALPAPATPDDEALQAAYEASPERYTAPERRAFHLVTLDVDDLIDEIGIDDESLRAEYDARIASYREPERRSVRQLRADSPADIEAAEDLIDSGVAFADAAIDGVSLEELGTLGPNELPGELSAAVFALSQGDVSAPVQSPFGWHLFIVDDITPEQVTPFREVRDALHDELARVEATDALPDLANRLDDELAAGLTLAEAADAVGLAMHDIPPVDRGGLNAEGERPADLPAWPAIFEEVFAAVEGETSIVLESDSGGYFVVEVTEIEPEHLMALDEVRDEVMESVEAERRQADARRKAENVRDRLGEVTTMEALAANDPAVRLETIAPITRTASDTDLSGEAVQALFALAPGEAADDVYRIGNSFAVIVLDDIIAAEIAPQSLDYRSLQAELDNETANDMLTQF